MVHFLTSVERLGIYVNDSKRLTRRGLDPLSKLKNYTLVTRNVLRNNEY